MSVYVSSNFDTRCVQHRHLITERNNQFLNAFAKNRPFYKGHLLNFLLRSFSSSKQFHACEGNNSNKAACGHAIWHKLPKGCGRCGVLYCPMKCRCME